MSLRPDGTVCANVLWYDDQADPDNDVPFLIDQVRLPYWFLYRDDTAREAYLLGAIAERAKELKRERERGELLRQALSSTIVHDLCHGCHRVTEDGKVVVRRSSVQEHVVQPGNPDALPVDPTDHAP